MLITANSIVNNVGISKLSFLLWEYTLLAEEKKRGICCLHQRGAYKYPNRFHTFNKIL